MILADTSIWVEFFRSGSIRFSRLLERGEIVIHTIVLGELAMGNLVKRAEALGSLLILPRLGEATFEECFSYLETQRLYGRGLGWNDVQLLVAAQLSHSLIWTRDAALARASSSLHLAYVAGS